jgi:hypothetical protein
MNFVFPAPVTPRTAIRIGSWAFAAVVGPGLRDLGTLLVPAALYVLAAGRAENSMAICLVYSFP